MTKPQSPSLRPEPDEPESLLEQMVKRLDASLRASGCTVTVKEPSDSTELLATFPQGRRPKQKRSKQPKVRVAVEWGYETHSVDLTADDWEAVQRGESVGAASTGWYEGSSFDIRWHFNSDSKRTLSVSYGEDGGDGYIGSLAGATVRMVP